MEARLALVLRVEHRGAVLIEHRFLFVERAVVVVSFSNVVNSAVVDTRTSRHDPGGFDVEARTFEFVRDFELQLDVKKLDSIARMLLLCGTYVLYQMRVNHVRLILLQND